MEQELVESVAVHCPLCAVRISLLLKPAKGVRVGTHIHQCERDTQTYSTYFRWSRFETGDTHTLSVLTEWKSRE